MKQKKVTKGKREINEASVKTKVRMTDNRYVQQRREVEHTELCVCMSAICAHFREATATDTKKAAYNIETNKVSNSHKIGYR
jgi:hypothetical protein